MSNHLKKQKLLDKINYEGVSLYEAMRALEITPYFLHQYCADDPQFEELLTVSMAGAEGILFGQIRALAISKLLRFLDGGETITSRKVKVVTDANGEVIRNESEYLTTQTSILPYLRLALQLPGNQPLIPSKRQTEEESLVEELKRLL